VTEVVIIEDDPEVRASTIRGLRGRGHTVTAASTGMAGLQLAVEARPDVVLLDLGLPDLDGSEILRMLRAVSGVPVIVTTARDDEAEIVKLLRNGADDYLVKPFGLAQLDARIDAVLRRTARPDEQELPVEVGGLRIDRRARVVTLDGSTLDLSPREFDVLHYLAVRADTVVTRSELLSAVWRLPYSHTDKTVDVHLSWLRRKLGETALKPRYLHSIRKVGVRLTAPTEAGPVEAVRAGDVPGSSQSRPSTR
jgi:two-component system KDP operon response regulator KdpE